MGEPLILRHFMYKVVLAEHKQTTVHNALNDITMIIHSNYDLKAR